MAALTDKQGIPDGNRAGGIVNVPVIVPLTKEGMINLSGRPLPNVKVGGNVPAFGKAKIQGSGVSRRA